MPPVLTRDRGPIAAALAVRDAAEAVAAGACPGDGARADVAQAAVDAVVAATAAAVLRWDPVEGRHRAVASAGYGDDAVQTLEAAFHRDPRFPAVRSHGRPLRVQDIRPADRRGVLFERVIRPARFADGVSLCLSTGGRYVGSVHASTAAAAVDDESVALLRLLSPDLAGLLDPLDGLPLVLADGADGGALAWSPSDGRTVPLGPAARPGLLGAGSPLTAWLVPDRWPSRLGRHLLVVWGAEILAVEARPAGRWVVVEHRPAAAPSDLSLRELEVLARLATGATNRMVACSLGITERTVATHVEHLLTKLGAGNRAGAAAYAVETGLVHVRAPRPA